jgi:hypothetical protein
MDEFAETRFVKVMRGAASHRKFRRMGRQLGLSRFEALGLTAALWEWTDTHKPFGALGRDFTAEDLTDSIGVEHLDPDDLVKAWIDVGLIDEDDDGYHVHGWMDAGRSGASALARSVKAREAAHKRWHPDRPYVGCSECNANANGDAPSHAQGYQQAPSEMPDVDVDEDEDEDHLEALTTERDARASETGFSLVDDPDNLRLADPKYGVSTRNF